MGAAKATPGFLLPLEGDGRACVGLTLKRHFEKGHVETSPGSRVRLLVADPQEAVSGGCLLSPGASTEPPLLCLYTWSELPVLVLFKFNVFQVKVRGRSGAAKFLSLQGVSGASSGQGGRLSAALSWR